jgi:hypothetical protein
LESWWLIEVEVEVVENIMVFIRWEKDSYRFISGSSNSGYDHEFEKVFLQFDEELEDSMSHHHIIEYEIAGKKWVVRSEADGYFEENSSDFVGQSKPEGAAPSPSMLLPSPNYP